MFQSRLRPALWIALAAMIAAVVAGCGSSGGGGGTSGVASVGSIKGTLVDSAGAPVGAATVTASGRTTTASNLGAFTLTSVPEGNGVVLEVAKDGYMRTRALVSVSANGTSEVKVTMIPTGNTVNINATTAQAVADDRADNLNATVQFQANSILNSAGAPVTSATVEITTAMPTDPSYADLFPGSFLGIGTGEATAGPIESFGFADVTLRDAAGNALRLDPAKPATINIPVAPTRDPGDATIPLWSLDPATGTWKQEGVATRVAGTPVVYTAQVTHFTPYNLDKRFEGGPLEVTVVNDASGAAVPGARVTVQSFMTSGEWQGRGVTGANGKVTITVPAGFIIVEATKDGLVGGLEGHAASTITVRLHAPT